MLKKSVFHILFIIFVSWIPLQEKVRADCGPCTAEQKKTCTDVKIHYEEPFDLPLEPEWTATMWYTPCGANSEASLGANDWKNVYSCCVQTGTHVKMQESDLSSIVMDSLVTKPELDIACMGYKSMEGAYASCCRDTAIPLPPCTQLTISYDTGAMWVATMQYTPCQKCAKPIERRQYLDDWTHTYSITPGTNVRIGPMWTAANYINEPMSGSEVQVQCSGHLVSESSCCVVEGGKCRKNSTNEPIKDKNKALKKTPSEMKAPQKTPSEMKAPQKTPSETKAPQKTPGGIKGK